MTKKCLVCVCMLFAIASSVCAQDSSSVAIELRQQSKTRAAAQFGDEITEMPALLKAMERHRFTHTNRVRVQQAIEAAEVEGLPTGPLAEKVHEGIAKGVSEERIVAAMSRVQSRYSYAYRQARQLGRTKAEIEQLGTVIAEANTAGFKQADCDKVVEKLRTQMRSQARQQNRAEELALQTMAVARLMARRGVQSETVADVLASALDQSYAATAMQQLQQAFLSQARRGTAQKTAAQLTEHVDSGKSVSGFGRSSRGGGTSGGSGGSGNGGQSGSSGGGAGGSSGGSSGGSDSGSGGSGNGAGSSGGSGGNGAGGSGSSGSGKK